MTKRIKNIIAHTTIIDKVQAFVQSALFDRRVIDNCKSLIIIKLTNIIKHCDSPLMTELYILMVFLNFFMIFALFCIILLAAFYLIIFGRWITTGWVSPKSCIEQSYWGISAFMLVPDWYSETFWDICGSENSALWVSSSRSNFLAFFGGSRRDAELPGLTVSISSPGCAFCA